MGELPAVFALKPGSLTTFGKSSAAVLEPPMAANPSSAGCLQTGEDGFDLVRKSIRVGPDPTFTA
jgi:hypothetical protein